jgi:hypothetical protein
VPSRQDLHNAQVAFRVRKRELAMWKRAAKRADEPFSLWARKVLNLAAVPPLPEVPPVVSGDQLALSFLEVKKGKIL